MKLPGLLRNTRNLKLKTNKENRGFTLIELLVVIAILAILAAIALTSYQSARKSGNDARRKSDLGQYRNALQNYATNNKGVFPFGVNCSYPSGCTVNCTCTGNSYTPSGIFYSSSPIIGTGSYLPALITDPLNTNTNNAYNYIQGSSSSYILYTQLENGTDTYWVVCSDGRSGTYISATAPTTCPVTL